MPTPRIPAGFKPVAAGYTIGAPSGVAMTEVAGGMPRVGLDWDRGKQQIQLGHVMSEEQFFVWTIWFQRVILNGGMQFSAPLNTGLGLEDHLCMMVPGTYSAMPLSGAKWWSVSFSVIAESSAYGMSEEDGEAFVATWEALEGTDNMSELIQALEKFATQDTTVLPP